MNLSSNHRTYVLALYREILRCAKTYPSIKRDQVISNIRAEFRINKAVSDQVQLDQLLDKAEHGLGVLRRYRALDQEASDWQIQL